MDSNDIFHLKLEKFMRKKVIIDKLNVLIHPYAYQYPNYSALHEKASFTEEDYVKWSDFIQSETVPTIEKKMKIRSFIDKYINFENVINEMADIADLPYKKGFKYGLYNTVLLDEGYQISVEFIMLFFELHGTKRTRFCREVERIVTTKAFRHLQYKTQVMINSASDDQRTRLLHSLEVQGIARTLAMQLGANWELAQAIALGHDVGHVPFGHAGEAELDRCLVNSFSGRFSHSLQSVKVLNELEHHPILKKYGLYGIGLSKRVLQGILKHDTDLFVQNVLQPEFQLQYDYSDFISEDENKSDYIMLGGMEAQIVYWSDKIAYLSHDWDEFINSYFLDEIFNCLNRQLDRMEAITTASFLDDNFTPDKKKEKACIFAIIREIKNSNVKFKTEKEYSLRNAVEGILKIKEDMPDRLFYFTKNEYDLLFLCFQTALAWIILTGSTQRVNESKHDVLYTIYCYFKDTKTRRIVPRLLDRVLMKTNCNIKAVSEYLKDEDCFISISNQRWQENRKIACEERESRKTDRNFQKKPSYEQNKEIKNIFRKKIQSSMLVSIDDETLHAVSDIDSFIFTYYINSTQVKFMTTKASTIIKRLFDFYMQHPEMLPIEHSRRKQHYLEKITDQLLLEYCITTFYKKGDNTQNIKWSDIAAKASSRISDIRNNNDYSATSEKALNYLQEEKIELYKDHVVQARIIADYIGDMTDRMAEKKYNEITSSETKWTITFND